MNQGDDDGHERRLFSNHDGDRASRGSAVTPCGAGTVWEGTHDDERTIEKQLAALERDIAMLNGRSGMREAATTKSKLTRAIADHPKHKGKDVRCVRHAVDSDDSDTGVATYTVDGQWHYCPYKLDPETGLALPDCDNAINAQGQAKPTHPLRVQQPAGAESARLFGVRGKAAERIFTEGRAAIRSRVQRSGLPARGGTRAAGRCHHEQPGRPLRTAEQSGSGDLPLRARGGP